MDLDDLDVERALDSVRDDSCSRPTIGRPLRAAAVVRRATLGFVDALNEIEAIVDRTIRVLTTIAERVTRYTTFLLAGVALIAVASFLLGVAALSNGIRTVWIVLGIVFAAWAIGAAFVARWRLGRIRKHVPAIANEMRALLTDGKGQAQLIIQEFQDDDDSTAESAIVVSRRLYGLRSVAGHGFEGSARLTDAVTAITTFPGLALVAVGITAVFGFLGFIFLIALAL